MNREWFLIAVRSGYHVKNLIVSVTELLADKMAFYYAVARGRNPGIYDTWEQCKVQIDKFSGPVFKKFSTKNEAENFIKTHKDTKKALGQGTEKAKPVDTATSAICNKNFKILEEYLVDFALDMPDSTLSDLKHQAEATATRLGILEPDSIDDWLQEHIKKYPHIYASMQLGPFPKTAKKSETAKLQKLINLENRILGSTSSGSHSISSRICILESTLNALQAELSIVKASFSTQARSESPDAARSKSPVQSRPKRKKLNETPEQSTSGKKNFNGLDDLQLDNKGYVNVFTDGACTSNGYAGACAGIGVWFGDNHPLNISEPISGNRATNNVAEIQAVTRAAQQATKVGIKKLRINTDSQFLISCITKWMRSWKRNGWRTAAGGAVINKTELLEMEAALQPLTIEWNHVRGHVGIHGNEMADQLARAGAAKYRSTKK